MQLPFNVDDILGQFKTKLQGDRHLSSISISATFQEVLPEGGLSLTSETLEFTAVLKGVGVSPDEFFAKRTIRPDTVVEERTVATADDLPAWAAPLKQPQSGTVIHGGAPIRNNTSGTRKVLLPPRYPRGAPSGANARSDGNSDSSSDICFSPPATQVPIPHTPSPAPRNAVQSPDVHCASTPLQGADPAPVRRQGIDRKMITDKFNSVRKEVEEEQAALLDDAKMQAGLPTRPAQADGANLFSPTALQSTESTELRQEAMSMPSLANSSGPGARATEDPRPDSALGLASPITLPARVESISATKVPAAVPRSAATRLVRRRQPSSSASAPPLSQVRAGKRRAVIEVSSDDDEPVGTLFAGASAAAKSKAQKKRKESE